MLAFDYRCLAHIINLAMQAIITTHSNSKHYDPADPDAELVGGDNGCDIVRLVQAICVKVPCLTLPEFYI